MLALFFASMFIPQPVGSEKAIALCKPSLSRKAGGEIATMDVSSSHVARGRFVIEGRLTAFRRMGPAPAGSARTHHLGRFEFTYRCAIARGRVREARVSVFRPYRAGPGIDG